MGASKSIPTFQGKKQTGLYKQTNGGRGSGGRGRASGGRARAGGGGDGGRGRALARYGGKANASGGGGSGGSSNGTEKWTYSNGGGSSVVLEKKVLDVVRMALEMAIDASSSMDGERIRIAVRGLTELSDVLRPSDLFGVSTFSREVKTLHRVMEKSKVNIAKDVQHVLANVGGCTAFYDAVVAGIGKLNDAREYLRSKHDGKRMPEWEHVMITDGQDNVSTATFEQACAAVRKPGFANYQFVVIGVGLSDQAAARLAEMCAPAHCHFHREADASALSRRLEELRKGYLLRLQVTSDGVTRTKTVTTADAAEADALQLTFLDGMMQLSQSQQSLGGGPKPRPKPKPKALTASAHGHHGHGHGNGPTKKCHWDRKCTNTKCTFKHSTGKCHKDRACTKHPLGQCIFRHSFSG